MSISRKFLWVISLLFVLFIAACTEDADIDAILELATSQVEIPDEVSASFTLPDSIEIEGFTIDIEWSSSNATYLSASGVVTRPGFSVGNQTVTLTATLSFGEFSIEETFSVTVLALPASTFVVSFESNGGSTVASINVTEGNLVTEPTDPTRAGFTFEGWYVEATLVTPFAFTETFPTGDLTLYAKWLAIPTFTVTFIPDNGTNIPSQTIFINGLVTEPSVPVKAGYTFVNWIKEDLTVWNFASTQVTSNVTLFANYTVNTYTITYVIPDGSTLGSGGMTSYTVLDPINDLGSAIKDNADFLGWFDAPTGGNKVTFYPAGTTGNITLYARFEDHIPLVVSFDDTMGNIVTQNRWEGQYAEPIADPIKPGYTFIGWFLNAADVEPFNFATSILSDTSLMAKYEIITYAINYDLKGGTANNPITYTIDTDDILLNGANKTGYTFIGWTYVDQSGDITTIIPKGSTGHKMLYATFVEIDYTITYHLDGGTLDVPNPLTYTITSSFVLSEPTKDGYVFEGWYTAMTEGEMIEAIEVGSTGHLVLHARYVELVSFNFFDEGNLNIDQYVVNRMYPYTEFVLTIDGLLYAKGSNEFGQIGNGLETDAARFIHITPFLGLEPGEFIEIFTFVDYRVVVLTSSGRVLIWGFQYEVSMFEFVFSNTPLDVTADFGLVNDEIIDIFNYGKFFVVKTSSQSLILYEDSSVEKSNPLYTGSGNSGVSPLYTGNQRPSMIFVSGESYFALTEIESEVQFLDVTSLLAIDPLKPIHAVFAEDESIHILNGDTYVYGFLTESTEQPFMVLTVPLTLTLNANETVVSIAGPALFTSQGRILVSVFIVLDVEDEIPSQIIYVDITDSVDLELGETIINLFNPGFILTSFNRLLMPQIEELFSTDPEFVPMVAMMVMDFGSQLEEDEEILSILFDGNLMIQTSQGFKSIQFVNQEEFIIVDFIIMGTTLVHIGEYPINQLDLFVPEDRPFEDFVGWYEDEELMIPFNPATLISGMNLYAKWEYTHYFLDFGYEWENLGIDRVATEYGQIPVQPEDPMRDMYVFSGWMYFDSEGQYVSYDFTYPLDQDTRLYPQWEPSEVDVTIVFLPMNQTIGRKGYEYYQAKAMYIELPEGYELIGIYLDEAMTMLAGENDLIRDYRTLYVLVQPTTYSIYYVENYEEVSFEAIYTIEQAYFGVTSDDRIFAWGSNSNGMLGFGSSEVYWIDQPIEVTQYFALTPGESITNIKGLYGTVVLLTSQGRMFAWGYQDSNMDFVTMPYEITSILDLQTETIETYIIGYQTVYVYLQNGSVKELKLKEGISNHYTSSLTFANLLFVERSYYGGYDTLLVTTQSIHLLKFADQFMIESLDFTSIMNGGTVIAIEKSYVGYMAYEVYLSNGLILLVDLSNESVSVQRTLTLLESETITRFIPSYGSAPFVWTSLDRLIELSFEGDPVVYNTALLLEGESVLLSQFGNLLTNKGRTLILDSETTSLISPTQVYEIGSATILKYVQIDWTFVAFTSDLEYVLSGETKTIYQKLAAVEIYIEFFEFGTVFVPRTPIGSNALLFQYWSSSVSYPYPYEGDPFSSMFLYGIYEVE